MVLTDRKLERLERTRETKRTLVTVLRKKTELLVGRGQVS